MSTTYPEAKDIVPEALRLHSALCADPAFPAFRAASLLYSEDWQCFTGFPVISNWSLEGDSPDLFEEGLRALALKGALYLATGDDKIAEVPIAVPVDEMTHAMLAQAQLLHTISKRSGVPVIHQTDQEHTDYDRGTITYAYYSAAWGEPNPRYWLDHHEVAHRRDHLASLYSQIGMGRSGREHNIDFAAA